MSTNYNKILKKLQKMQQAKGNIGKYEIYKTLGTGGTCKVKLGKDTETNQWVAVKILFDKLEYSAEVMTQNEVNAMSMLNNKHIIK